ncbi:hypothetical protein DFH06DRAFT_1197099 [Mycena polygramma]|nr:hypothetical protein DFH06DRAFT_1197099 [Mycena polygramma]
MPRVATSPSRSSKLNGPTRRRTPPSPPLKVLCSQPGCPWSYRSQTDLNRHLPQHMSPEEREKLMHKCMAPGCTFKCLQKSNLNTHFTAKHTDAKPYTCDDCPYRTADPASFNRHKSAMHDYVSGSAKRKTKTQAKALFLDAVARSTPSSDASGSSSGSWSSAPSPLSSMDFPSAFSENLFTFDSSPVSPNDLYLDIVSPSSSSSGSFLPMSSTSSGTSDDLFPSHSRPISPADLYPNIFSPSSSESSLPTPPTTSSDGPMLWHPELEMCLAVGGAAVESTLAPGPAVFYPAEGVNFFVAESESDTVPYFPASFDMTQFLSNFSAPPVYESPICSPFELQGVNTPFMGEWSDVVC